MKNSRISLWTLALMIPLALGIILSGCKKDDDDDDDQPCQNINVDFSVLDAKIAEAQVIHDAATEGTELGNYEAGSKAELQDAIDLAQGVRDTDCVSQTEVDNAVVALDAALVEFESHKITDVAPDALVAQWLLNGDATDNSGSRAGHNGVISAGHADWGAGMPELAVDRHGNADYCYLFQGGGNIVVPASPDLYPQEITISFWCNMNESWAHNYVMSMDIWHCWKLQIQDANKPYFTRKVLLDGNEAYIDKDSESGVLELDRWYHIAVTWTSGEMVFYIDGQEVKKWTEGVEGVGVTPDAGIDFCIGQALPTDDFTDIPDDPHQWQAWTGHFKGYLDDIRIYNTVLTGPQVGTLYTYEKDNVVE